jgi:hypothetical protein
MGTKLIDIYDFDFFSLKDARCKEVFYHAEAQSAQSIFIYEKGVCGWCKFALK